MGQIGTIDILIILLYLCFCIVLGIYLVRRQRTFETFILADRELGFIHTCGTFLSTLLGFSVLYATAILAFQFGISVLWGPVAYLCAFIVFYLFANRLKTISDNLQFYTYADMLGARFGRSTQFVGSLTMLIVFLCFVSINIFAIGTILSILTGLSILQATLLAGGIVIIYTMCGGFLAIVWTDVFQFLFIMLGLIVILPLAYLKVNAAGGLSTNLPPEFFNLSNWGIENIVGMFFVVVPVFLASQDVWQRVFAAKDLKTAKRSIISAGFIIFIFTVCAIFIGLYGKVLLPDVNPQLIVPALITKVLGPGLIGIVLVGFLSAFMSSADSFIMVVQSSFVQDFYRGYFNKDADDKQLLIVSRVATAVSGAIPIIICILVPDFVKILFNILTWILILIPATLAGFFWKKTNETAATASITVGWVVALIWALGPGDSVTAGAVAVLPTIAVLLLVSFFGKPPKQEVLEQFNLVRENSE